jgi:orotidine-5'-phosphate decarboxylase
VGLLVNSSRGIIYAGKEEGFEEHVAHAAKELQVKMKRILDRYNLG